MLRKKSRKMCQNVLDVLVRAEKKLRQNEKRYEGGGK